MSVNMDHPEFPTFRERVVTLFRRVATDRRAIASMEIPEELVSKFGLETVCWGVPFVVGPALAVIALDFGGCEQVTVTRKNEDSSLTQTKVPETLPEPTKVRYEEEPA